MTASHGRAGRSRPIRALVASGLCLAGLGLAARPALACHIAHHSTHPTTATTATAATTPAVSPTSTQTPAQALKDFMKVWDERTKPQAQAITPTSAPTSPHTIAVDQSGRVTSVPATHPAAQAQVVAQGPSPASTTPAVHDWHQTAAANHCTPPTPPSVSGATSPTAQAQVVAPTPTPLKPPAAFLNPATPAPEPSTILIGVALAGAFAWRRRAARPKA